MQRRALQLLAIGCLVALAGCSGALSGTDGPADEPSLQDVSYPDGVSENGTNASALARTHAEALNGSSFTLELRTSQNSSVVNRSMALRAAVGPDREAILVNASGAGRATSMYLTGERRYVRLTADGKTQYQVTDRAPDATKLVSSSYSGATYVRRFAGQLGADLEPTGVRVVDDTTLLVLRADGSNVSAPRGNVTDYNATVLVDQRGVIHSFEVNATSQRKGSSMTVSLSMTVSDVNSTAVEEPDWLDEARNRTNNSTASGS